MNILFVCSVNKIRSKTAEDYFSGTNIKTCLKEGTNPLEKWMLEWADVIHVMEKKHKEEIVKSIGTNFNKKINILNIKDVYKYYQKELIDILKEKIVL